MASAGADDARFGFLDALAHALLTQGGNFDLTLEALDHIPDLRLDLLLEPGEIGVELLHARVRGQQRRRQLGELALEAHALLHQPRHQGGFLHVGERLAAAAGGNLARLIGTRECLRLGRCRLSQLGR